MGDGSVGGTALRVLSTCFAVAVLGAVAAAQTTTSPEERPAATYVGSEVCASCHDDVEAKLKETQHGKAGFAALSAHGCEPCHGPGSAHAEDPDNEALRLRVDTLPAAQQSQTCLSATSAASSPSGTAVATSPRPVVHQLSQRARGQVDQSQLKAANAMEQCVPATRTCARRLEDVAPPAPRGKISCADCHNPHGSTTPKLITASSVNEQCYSCPAEKRGPFLWSTAGARER